MDLSEDQFLGGEINLFQPVHGYRAATDPVFLAAAIPAKDNQSVLDVGCGVGTASFCLLARHANLKVLGLDIQADLIEIAKKNAAHNEMSEKAAFHQGNLLERPLIDLTNSFDHVMANPPFYEAGSGQKPPNEIKAKANMEIDGGLIDWVNYMFKMAKPRATLTMINRIERLDETLAAFMGRVGEVIIYPLWSQSPDSDIRKGAKRFLIQGRKSIKSPLKLSPGMTIHDEQGGYREKAKEILMTPTFLDLGK